MMIALAIWAIVCAVWIALGALPAGLDGYMPLPYLIALSPFLWIPSLALAALAAWQGEWGMTWTLGALALAAPSRRVEYWRKGFRRRPSLADRIVERTRHDDHNRETSRETESKGRGTARETSLEAPSQLRLMTLNCRFGRADAADIVRQARERDVDVLALEEVSESLVARLDEAGIARLLPYRQSGEPKTGDNGGFNILFLRHEPAAGVPDVVDIPAADVPAVVLRMADGRTVTIAAAHTKSPMRGCAQWSAGIIGLGELAKAEHIGDRDIAVVMGDLNASLEHPSFRALLRSGFRDASLTQGRGPSLTFPSWTPWPRIELDHILATPGVTFHDVEPVRVAGTDHLALTATLRLREARIQGR
ncbi:endonuclease/exonuclease/phosphatase family protein [Bifidobacterium saguinibicoloris]|uniref:endonuclease/exonuclease/phosphatase family protein n=1 Tax=Bifidobacterium saguinibicoloris TaxID=2834433 RepID=UPI001C56557A|nr:endonuclease/exonuclease/phosphatase family protein [Bifidobacterium saguinibicoloris]MBW3080224.1 endonuclease/exonuclease/phosphatase family protein [Bifidobacterium saguinibicoloris]